MFQGAAHEVSGLGAAYFVRGSFKPQTHCHGNPAHGQRPIVRNPNLHSALSTLFDTLYPRRPRYANIGPIIVLMMPKILSILFVALAATSARGQAPPTKIDFKRDVVPILDAGCFSCHRGAEATASYRLDLRAELLGETTGRPLVVVGKSDDSRLIQAVKGKLPGKLMPRNGPRLSEREIDVLRAWIDQGLAWDERLFPAESKSDHWAFRPIETPPLPKVKNRSWIVSPIDAFIAQQHERAGLSPAPAADGRTLVRRLSFDLTGLPPTPSMVDEFSKAWDAAGAKRIVVLEETVERFLASPHYGERWGRHWLDVARWAESEGYESNHLRPFAWRYRDWVVQAFNRDLPFDQFVKQQLAGDEMTPYADEHLIATGFLAAARLSSNEEDRIRQRNDIHVDIVNATASAFLGLTMQCAQCHNHKFDPITARDYYRFMGFFVKGQFGNYALRDAKLWAEYEAKKPKGYDALLTERDTLYDLGKKRRTDEVEKSLTSDQKRALALPREVRTPEDDKVAREADLLFQFSMGLIERALTAEEKKRYDAAKKSLVEMEKGMLPKPQAFSYYSPVTSPHRIDLLPMQGFYPLPFDPKFLAGARPFLYEAGDVHRPAFAVDVGWPTVFGGKAAQAIDKTPRLALANWLTNKESGAGSLTARVYVNRIWQHHFGRGLVATPSDFGVRGARPTHPHLLDFLASELLRTGSTKHIHRLIVTSNTYRQAATNNAANAKRDADNRFLWCWQPRRLEAEAIRDAFLAVSGELDRQVGGPSAADDKNVRRSLYALQKRESPPPLQGLFDGPIGMTESCARRQTTTVALQPLYLLNNDFSVERAKALARRVTQQAGAERERQISAAYRLALGREPDAEERAAGQRFFDQTASDAESALAHYCQAILNLNEFVYLE